MARFRKKPVVIEAFQLGIDYIPDWFMDKVTTNDIILHGTSSGFEHHDDINADIKTLEGWHHANFGDFIIKGTAGEIYPCKPHIFKDIYESADTTADVAPKSEVAREIFRDCHNCHLIDEDICTCKDLNYVLDLINRQRAGIDQLCAIIYEISEAMKGIVIIELDGQPIPRKNTSRHDVYKACDKIQSILWRYKCQYIDFQLAQLRAQREDNPGR